MEKRAQIPPGLPRANPTISYWQEPPDPIANHRTTSELPETADIAIIGSGISGACIAYNLLEKWPEAKIVMFEARQACSGATGRNGGHTKGASYRTFLENKAALGLEQALQIVRLEYENIKAVHAFARDHGIECDLQSIDTVDIILDQAQWNQARVAISELREAMEPGEPAAEYQLWDSEEAKERFRVAECVGAITYEAGSLSAYKLVVGILKLGLDQGLNLQANTPVVHLSPAPDASTKELQWVLKTGRGQCMALKVVLATNGYTAHLYPDLQGVIVPLRGQITAQRPGSNLPAGSLKTTYSFIYDGGFEYMIPRPPGSVNQGDIVIGGGLTKAAEGGLFEIGNADDSALDPDIDTYLTNTTLSCFGEANWGQDSPKGRIRSRWSGIMGYSADGYPLVGSMPNTQNLFISASFQGHGMVLCFMCAKAVASIILDEEVSQLDSWFPRTFIATEERMQRKFTGGPHVISAEQAETETGT